MKCPDCGETLAENERSNTWTCDDCGLTVSDGLVQNPWKYDRMRWADEPDDT